MKFLTSINKKQIEIICRTIDTTKSDYKSYQYEGVTVIKKSKTSPWTVSYNYFVKIGGKDEVEEYIFNQGQKDFTARIIPSEKLVQKGKNSFRTFQNSASNGSDCSTQVLCSQKSV